MTAKRKKHSAKFKFKVALEAVKGLKTSSQIASEYGVATWQISTWKKIILSCTGDIFERNTKAKQVDQDAVTAPLYEEIGRLKMELDWLKKKADIIDGK